MEHQGCYTLVRTSSTFGKQQNSASGTNQQSSVSGADVDPVMMANGCGCCWTCPCSLTLLPQVVLTRRHLGIVMNYAAGGDLHSYCERFKLDESVARCAQQLSAGSTSAPAGSKQTFIWGPGQQGQQEAATSSSTPSCALQQQAPAAHCGHRTWAGPLICSEL